MSQADTNHTMETAILPLGAPLLPAADLLRAGEVVAIPTETVYGLAANALNGEAARKIFAAKGRPLDNPLICHISSLEMLDMLIDTSEPLPEKTRKLMDTFWPGPLTLLLRKNKNVPDEVTCGLPTVGVRFPSHEVARQLIDMCGFPLAAPSANASGRPSPTRAEHVLNDLRGKIPMIVDGGQAACGVESTVVDVSGLGASANRFGCVLRPGGVTIEQLRTVIPDIQVHGKDFTEVALEENPSTPGMKYRHYTPRAPVVLVEASDSGEDSLRRQFAVIERELVRAAEQLGMDDKGENLSADLRQQQQQQRRPIGLLSFEGPQTQELLQRLRVAMPSVDIVHRSLGSGDDLKIVAFELFAGLRDLDAQSVASIVVQGVCEEHEGLAVMNRLRKAAGSICKSEEIQSAETS